MKKGFTLIELLAVIVILAIIAVIAVPIVLNIIEDTKKSAVLRSADFYLDGVEKSIATAMLKNIQISDGTYSIMQDGNLCIGTLNNNTCTGDILKVEMDGEVPKEGTIKIKDGQIKKVDITISDKEVWTDPFTEKLEYKLAPGLYDENDGLLASWDELNQLMLERNIGYDFEEIIQSEYGDGVYVIDSIEGASKLVIADSVTIIGVNAFADCTSLKEVVIPEGVTSIGDAAFSGCESLTSITIPDSVTSIGGWAFIDCTSLKEITIPEGVTNLDISAFYFVDLDTIKVDKNNPVYDNRDNSNAIIETATDTLLIGANNTIIPNSVTSIEGGAFTGRTKLKEVTIPEGVTVIDYETFDRCSSLQTVNLPSTLIEIKPAAFRDCISLKEIVIPESVTIMGEEEAPSAFGGCDNLTTIYYKGTAPLAPWGATNAKVETNF